MTEKQHLQWHPAFVAATMLEFFDEPLEFKMEYALSRKPLQIDLLICKHKRLKRESIIGQLFKTYNIFEYKSPGHTLNIDAFYKTIGYACLFKAEGKRADEYKSNEITISFVYESRPKKLMKQLQQRNLVVSNPYNGIYYIDHMYLIFHVKLW